jgi:hypothetical protein
MNRIVLSAAFALAATPFAMHGADLIENPNLPDNPNRFSFGPTFGINFKADFRNNASSASYAPGGGTNYTYNDGQVLVDSGTPANNLTGNWNYQYVSQYNNNYDEMQFLRSGPSSSITGNPQYGGEFIYQRVIGSLPALSGDWGLESGFGFTELDMRENLGGTATVDSFLLNGVALAFPPGYNGGSSESAVPLLSDTAVPGTATLSGYQKLSGHLFSLRLGPFAELNFTPKLSLAASVGLTLAPTTVDYDFSEIATVPGDTITENGHSSKTKLLYGPYVGGMLRYNFNKNWGVYVGARFQNLTSLDQSVGGRTARLDPSVTFYGSAGATWSF